MTKLLGIAFLLLIVVGCKNKESSQEYDSSANSDTSYSITGESTHKEDKTNALSLNNEKEDKTELVSTKSKVNSNFATIAGNYIKLGEEADVNCNCYCLDINYNNNSIFCLSQGKMYINVKFEKNQNGTSNVYLVNPSNKNLEGKDIPWDKFDRNIPIATLENLSDGLVKLDWLGFTINGDLATDYAIYGKKTLEGNYKIK